MKIDSAKLIHELTEMTIQNRDQVTKLKELPITTLNWKESDDKWSILECIEHLNLYSDFYIPEITLRIKESKYKNDDIFKSGILGNYFAKSMLPKEKLNTMKTFKDKNPNGSKLDALVIDKFIDDQKTMLTLLNESKKVNLTKTKTSISISTLLKLRLGDTLRVVVYHNLRHIKQAEKCISPYSLSVTT